MRSWMERGGRGGYKSLLTLKSRKARWDFTRKYLKEPAEFKKQTDLWTDTLPKKKVITSTWPALGKKLWAIDRKNKFVPECKRKLNSVTLVICFWITLWDTNCIVFLGLWFQSTNHSVWEAAMIPTCMNGNTMSHGLAGCLLVFTQSWS